MDGANVSPRLWEAAKHNEKSSQVVAGIQNIRKLEGNLQLLVEWEGVPDLCGQTWEPKVNISKDAAEVFEEFLSTPGEDRLKSNVRSVLKDNNQFHK